MLVHMTPKEVHGLQALAKASGGSLSINPDTGLVEAGFLTKILPVIAAAAATYFTAGAAAPALAAAMGGSAAATAGAGINFTSGGSIQGVADIDGTGTLTIGSVSATTSIQTGLLAVTVSEYDFIGLKSLVSGSGTVATTEIAANDIVFLTPQCQNVGGTALYYTVTVNAGVGFTIQSKVLATGVANITDTSTIGFVVIRAA
jgi:hypothetical protein